VLPGAESLAFTSDGDYVRFVIARLDYFAMIAVEYR